ncbi:lipopolysaccharide transport periplasmic protein LptA [Burkholderiaceae bacterium]
MIASFVPWICMTFVSFLSSMRRWAGLSLLCVTLGAQAQAPAAPVPVVPDRDQPMNAEADELRYDDARKTNVFTGNVVITKGTIVIRGHRVEVRQDAAGNQFGVIESGPKHTAFFRQQRQGLNEWIEGEAVRINYDSGAGTVVLTGQAVMRRLRGNQVSDESSGEVITYNSNTDEYKVKGAAANAKTPPGRVRLMLTPQPTQESGVVSGPATLTPSTQLNKQP